jgi:DNA polymerase-1
VPETSPLQGLSSVTAPALAPDLVGKSLFLIDGANLAYRSYFAFIRAPLTNSRGLNTSAPFGFTQTLTKLIDDAKPDYLAVVWDPKGPTERHETYAEYKAHRKPMPDDLREAMPYIRKLVDAYNIKTVELAGIEADDVIGTIALNLATQGLKCFIVSSDKDFLQLVTDDIRLYNLRKGWTELEVLGPEETLAKWGVGPEGIRDVLALMGDASDNVPGVPGIGKKTAVKLIAEHKTLEGVYENLPTLRGKKLKERLTEHREQAELSRDLVTIRTDLELEDVDLEAFELREPDLERLLPLLRELEFKDIAERLARKAPTRAQHVPITVESVTGEFGSLLAKLEAADRVAIEVIAEPGDPAVAKVLGVAFAVDPDHAYFVPTRVESMPGSLFAGLADRGRLQELLERIGPWLRSDKPKLGHGLKTAVRALAEHDATLGGVCFDTRLASYMIDPSRRLHALSDLTPHYLGETLPDSAHSAVLKKAKLLEALGSDELAQLGGLRAAYAMRLAAPLERALDTLTLMRPYREIELPLIPILVSMERAGVRLDLPLLEKISVEFEDRLAVLTDAITEIAGETFNIDSPKQLQAILFDKHQIHKELGVRVKRTKTGYSTDQTVLEQLSAHPIVDKILAYRQLRKLKGTYVDALPQLADANQRVHTTLNQDVTATGRLSSNQPNLQNIPIRTEEGRRIRAAFDSGSWPTSPRTRP